MINILLYFCLLLFLFSCSLEENQASEIQFHTLDISAHLSLTSVCNRASTNGPKKRASASSAVLEVVHKQGPCAPKNTQKIISLAEILAEDQLRVQSIHKSHHKNTNKGEDKEAKLQVPPGDLGTGNYIVSIGFGTPVRKLSLVFDTGSDVTWIQCQPCLRHCYRQKETVFNPSASKTYSKIPCRSRECLELSNYSNSGCYQNSMCLYGVQYGDGSYTIGFYSRDKLTVTPVTDVFPGFQFGCGQNNTGTFGRAAGILGLGRSPLSFVSQTAEKYSQVFSYCLPDKRSPGFLSFGGGKHNNKNDKAAMIITPLFPPPRHEPPLPFYYVEITSISVGKKQIASVFTIVVDSGTVITRLPPAAYRSMSAEFKRQMTTNYKYKSADPFDILDTCFQISNLANIRLPTMSITFRGNATLDLDANGLITEVSSKVVCLAFAPNTDPRGVAIFGNTQQRKVQVMFDVPGQKVGFRSNPNCQL